MEKLSVTQILNDYHNFDSEFWLSYKTLEKIHPDFDAIKMTLLRSKRIDKRFILDPILFETERNLLAAEWKQKNEEAKQLGTTTHETIHNMFCTDLKGIKSLGVDTDLYQVQKIENFLNTEKGIFPEFRIELPLDDDFTLVGIPDLVIKDGNEITIIDWKTNDSIKFRSMFEVGKKKTKRMKFPLNKLDDCDGIRYQLQLSLYAKMIESLNPNFIIKSLVIVQVKNLKKKKEFPVEYLSDEAEMLIKYHVKHLKLRRELAKCKQIEY